MRLGVMIGAERGDMARKVKKFLQDIEWAEAAGLDTAWMPQVPDDFDALTMVALMGTQMKTKAPLQIKWHPVTVQNRMDAVAKGQADMECGSTTVTLARLKQVDFSSYIFVDGTGLMTRNNLGIRSTSDSSAWSTSRARPSAGP